jgi:hypothetical protein
MTDLMGAGKAGYTQTRKQAPGSENFLGLQFSKVHAKKQGVIILVDKLDPRPLRRKGDPESQDWKQDEKQSRPHDVL